MMSMAQADECSAGRLSGQVPRGGECHLVSGFINVCSDKAEIGLEEDEKSSVCDRSRTPPAFHLRSHALSLGSQSSGECWRGLGSECREGQTARGVRPWRLVHRAVMDIHLV